MMEGVPVAELVLCWPGPTAVHARVERGQVCGFRKRAGGGR